MKTKQEKNTVAIILGIILILCISVVGVLVCRNTDLSVLADTNADYGENTNASQFDIIDYQGNKVYATYQYVKLNETECSVRITNKTLATTADIPSEGIIDGKKYAVTEIAANGFMSSTNLKVVNLSHSIKKIGNMAFANCSQLQYVDLFNVEELGNSVFYRCTNLETIVIPNSVNQVGSYVFRNNNTQVEIRAAEQLCLGWDNSWNTNNSNQDVHYESKYKRNMQADIVYNDSVRSGNLIKGFMITNGTSNLSDIALLEPFEPDQDNNIIIPSEYQYTDGEYYPILAIARHAFEASSFDNLIIEYSTTELSIGFNVFEFTESESESGTGMSIIINRPISFFDLEEKKVSDNTFVGSALENIILPEGCDIASNMFNGCEKLKNIFFESPQNYGDNEVDKLNQKLDNLLKSGKGIVNITENVESIGESAFDGTTNLTELHLSDKIKNVGQTILANWDKNNQKVFVHNTAPINYKTDSNSDGWHVNWDSGFPVELDLKFYKIEFDPLDGKLNNELSFIHLAKGDIIPELPVACLDEHHTFTCWKDEYGNPLVKGKEFNYDSDITVHAVYDDVIYKITLNPMGGRDGTEEVQGIYNQELPEALQPIKEGWIFKGYFTKEEGDGDKYYDASESNDRKMAGKAWNKSEDTILYAFWVEKKTTITYKNIPAGVSNDNADVVRGEDILALKDLELARGYHFDGWYLNGVKVTSINTEMGNEIELTAKCLGSVIQINKGSQLINISDEYAIIVLPTTLDSSCTINISASVKQVYMYSNNPKYLYKINFNIAARNSTQNRNFYLLLENVNFQAEYNKVVHTVGPWGPPVVNPNPYSKTGLAEAINMVYTHVNTCLHLYAYGEVSIKGANGVNGSDGKNAIYCQNLYIHYTGKNNKISILGGDGSKSDTITGNPAVAVLADVSVKVSSDYEIYYDKLIICGGYFVDVEACAAALKINSGRNMQYVDD